MQLTFTMAELAEQIQRELRDPDGNRYKTSVILDLLDQAQYRAAVDSEELRTTRVISTRENRKVYNYPDDYLKLIHMTHKDGGNIKPVTSAYLKKREGGNFLTRTTSSNPSFVFSDLVGQGKFQLYPNPDTLIDVAPLQASRKKMIKTSRVFDNLAGMAEKDGRIYVVDDAGIVVLNEQMIRSRVIPFSDTALSALTNITFARRKPGFDFFVSQNTKLYKFDQTEAETTFITSSESITFLSDLQEATERIIYASTGNIYHVVLDTATDAVLFAGKTFTQGIYDISSGNHFLAMRSDGLYKCTDSAGALTQLTTTKCDGVCILSKGNTVTSTASKMYVNLNGTLNAFNPLTEAFTATTITTLAPSSILLRMNSEKLYAFNTSRNLVLINTTTQTIENTWSEFVTNDAFIRPKDWAVANGHAYALDIQDRVDTGFTEMYQSDNEYGAVVTIDGITATSEPGAVVDVTDTEDIVTFNGDAGGIRSITSSSEVAEVYYVRCPALGQVEISEPYALKAWVKYKLKEEEGDGQSTRLSRIYKAEYESYIRNMKSRVAGGFTGDSYGSLPVNF